MGHVIVVPATGTPYESICRKTSVPPAGMPRTKPTGKNDKVNPRTIPDTGPVKYEGC